MNTNEITWTDDDVRFVEKAIEIRNRGYFIDGGQLVGRYNKILHKNRPTTNCSSCLRAYITELEVALNRFKKQLETSKKEEETDNKTPKKTKKKEG